MAAWTLLKVETSLSLHPYTLHSEAWVSENTNSLPASCIPMLSFERHGRSLVDAINTPFSPPEPVICPSPTLASILRHHNITEGV